MGDYSAATGGLTYREAGVDIEAGEQAVRLIKDLAESTFIPGVLGSLGGFAGLFALPEGLKDPVLVASTDGVGTKVLVAKEVGRLDTVGIDLVAMSVNDVLAMGARPVLFLDYLAMGKLSPQEVTRLVAGVAEGCRQAGCALIGGEMAEMPGLYAPEEFDLAGFCVGVVERDKIIDGSKVALGDKVVGLASSGFHSNGYSLIRKVLEVNGLSLTDHFPGQEQSVAEVLLRPTRIYVRSVLALLEAGAQVHGLAHITGGGLPGNVSRVIPDGLCAEVCLDCLKVPAEFRVIQDLGHVREEEMFRTFNMGIGYVIIIDPHDLGEALTVLEQQGESPTVLGEIVAGYERVVLR
ncbi:MAG: phosphoribosylformylglycinamidine cyclo-ligase [Thermoleophilia bacterium]|nr:phosphoribosylformylglycinamidine cyclo-ligase [Thermoleophilia bacterium]